MVRMWPCMYICLYRLRDLTKESGARAPAQHDAKQGLQLLSNIEFMYSLPVPTQYGFIPLSKFGKINPQDDERLRLNNWITPKQRKKAGVRC